MKVEGAVQLANNYSAHFEMPVIKVNEIKSILYLGIKGDIKMKPQETPAINVDMAIDKYA